MDSSTLEDSATNVNSTPQSGDNVGPSGGISPAHNVTWKDNSNPGSKPSKRKTSHAENDGNANGKKDMKKRLTRNRGWDGVTRRDKNVDTRVQDVPQGEESSEKEERRPKKKVACFIGYSGEGYHGMQ